MKFTAVCFLFYLLAHLSAHSSTHYHFGDTSALSEPCYYPTTPLNYTHDGFTQPEIESLVAKMWDYHATARRDQSAMQRQGVLCILQCTCSVLLGSKKGSLMGNYFNNFS